MSRNLLSLPFAAALLAGTAQAEVPRVATDIAPVQALVAQVMGDLGTPALVVAPGATPHEYSLRPSEAGALQDADLVFWIGPDLTPWLADALDTLAADASVVELMQVEGTMILPFREGALFETHSHGGEGHEDHEDHDHEDHAEEDHDHAAHDDHEGHDHAGHDHGAHDPHVWLSPDNGATWLNAIAGALSAQDPDNAGVYFGNAAAGRAELETLKADVNDILDPVRDRNFIVFHDAYQYFEQAFDFPASGAITVSDAADPSPARVAEVQARVAEQNVTCVLSEPQFNPGIVDAVMGGSEANTGVLDPLGSDLETGPALYGDTLRNLARALADCL